MAKVDNDEYDDVVRAHTNGITVARNVNGNGMSMTYEEASSITPVSIHAANVDGFGADDIVSGLNTGQIVLQSKRRLVRTCSIRRHLQPYISICSRCRHRYPRRYCCRICQWRDHHVQE